MMVGVQYTVQFSGGDSPADVEIAVKGVPTVSGFVRLNESLVFDARFGRGVTMLVDCSDLDTEGLTDDDVQALTEPMSERDWHHPPLAVALVPPERVYEAVRLYRAHLGGSRSNRHLFKSRDEAIAWLEEQRA